MMYRAIPDGLRYVYAEFCPGPFYMGWWLYASPLVDDKPQRDSYVWLAQDWRLESLWHALALPLPGPAAMPVWSRWHNSTGYTHIFMQAYPNGVTMNITGDGRTFEVVPSEQLWDYARQVREAQLRSFLESGERLHDQLEQAQQRGKEGR